jgi:cell division protease FtsH
MKYRWQLLGAFLLLAAGTFYWIQWKLDAAEPKEVYYSEFIGEVRAGRVASVTITDNQLVGVLKTDGHALGKMAAARKISAYRLPGLDEAALLKEFETRQVRFTGQDAGSASTKFMAGLLVLLVLGATGYCVWRVKAGAGGLLGLGKSGGKIYEQTDGAKFTFNDVAGIDESKAELAEVVDFLKQPQNYQKLGGRVPRGLLLVGPPGTGKTLLAKAVAGEADVPFFSISGSEFVEMYVGVGAARVRNLFKRAKRVAPCIIFIDELDAIGKSRSSDRRPGASNEEREQTLNQLLVEMDGFDTSTAVIVVAATNTPEVLDPALVRPGRFDRQILVDRADLKGREAILRIHARNVKLAPGVDLSTIAGRTAGMVGADLANVINEAALLGARRKAEVIEMRDLEEAIDRVILGLEKKNRVMNERERQRVAYHETGHALIALSVEHADPVHRVSIIPRSIGALGHVLQLPTEEKYLMTKPEIEDQLAVMLGGRASEEIIYDGVVSTGASNDLERASELVRQMVTRYGMSEKLGQLTYGRTNSSRHLNSPSGPEERNYSEHTAQMIDQESRGMLDEIYGRVLKILMDRREDLERVAQELMRKETLDREDLRRLLSPVQEQVAS